MKLRRAPRWKVVILVLMPILVVASMVDWFLLPRGEWFYRRHTWWSLDVPSDLRVRAIKELVGVEYQDERDILASSSMIGFEGALVAEIPPALTCLSTSSARWVIQDVYRRAPVDRASYPGLSEKIFALSVVVRTEGPNAVGQIFSDAVHAFLVGVDRQTNEGAQWGNFSSALSRSLVHLVGLPPEAVPESGNLSGHFTKKYILSRGFRVPTLDAYAEAFVNATNQETADRAVFDYRVAEDRKRSGVR